MYRVSCIVPIVAKE